MKLLSQFYAWVFGYFWLPCPKCGTMFGGHQVAPGGAHIIVERPDGQHCMCVCPACDTEELRAENRRDLQQQMTQWMSAMQMGGAAIRIHPGETTQQWLK